LRQILGQVPQVDSESVGEQAEGAAGNAEGAAANAEGAAGDAEGSATAAAAGDGDAAPAGGDGGAGDAADGGAVAAAGDDAAATANEPAATAAGDAGVAAEESPIPSTLPFPLKQLKAVLGVILPGLNVPAPIIPIIFHILLKGLLTPGINLGVLSFLLAVHFCSKLST
jgi:hypothetical protein